MIRATPLFALALFGVTPASAQSERWDLLITGGTIIDGRGGAGFTGDIAVGAGRIVRVSRTPLSRTEANRVIEARGLVVAPGFIDVHAHIEGILQWPDAESAVRQGVTLAVGGPDGGGPWPFGAHLDAAARAGLGLHVAFLVGHNTVRREVMGLADRAPTPEELGRMRRMVAEAMGQGAFGLSTGLFYLPGTFASTQEVVALAEVAADSGGIYTSHLRNESLRLIEGVAEALEIGQRARIPVVLTHHKAVGPRMRGASARTLRMVDSARGAGTDVMMDQYPYTATATAIGGALMPAWVREGGDSAFRRRVADPALRDSLVRDIVRILEQERGGGDLRRVQFSSVPWQRDLEGRTLHDWALERGLEPTARNGADLVIEVELRGGAGGIYHVIDESDVVRIMRHPMTMVASDGGLSRPGSGHPHPRSYGTFPRVLGVYVREQGVLTLPEAVRRMTSLPADRLGLVDRGRIAEGAVADLTLFDPMTVRDRSTFVAPHQFPEGIPYVIVAGVPVIDGGRFTSARPGSVVRRRPGKGRAG